MKSILIILAAAAWAAILLPGIAYADIPAIQDAFSPRQGATALVVHTIDDARHTLRVAAYSFTSRPIADALIAARQRGVDGVKTRKCILCPSRANERATLPLPVRFMALGSRPLGVRRGFIERCFSKVRHLWQLSESSALE